MKELINQGARKIAMVGLPPMGCLPIVITLNKDAATHGRKCVEPMLSVAIEYNIILENKLKAMQTAETKLYYADIYKPILDMIQFGESKLGKFTNLIIFLRQTRLKIVHVLFVCASKLN